MKIVKAKDNDFEFRIKEGVVYNILTVGTPVLDEHADIINEKFFNIVEITDAPIEAAIDHIKTVEAKPEVIKEDTEVKDIKIKKSNKK